MYRQKSVKCAQLVLFTFVCSPLTVNIPICLLLCLYFAEVHNCMLPYIDTFLWLTFKVFDTWYISVGCGEVLNDCKRCLLPLTIKTDLYSLVEIAWTVYHMG